MDKQWDVLATHICAKVQIEKLSKCPRLWKAQHLWKYCLLKLLCKVCHQDLRSLHVSDKHNLKKLSSS